MTTVTQSDFAALIGNDKSYISRLKQAGRLVLTADGMVDVEKSQALIAATADPSRPAQSAIQTQARADAVAESPRQERAAPDAIGNSFAAAKAVREKYNALTAKAEYEQLIGKLVDADEARLFAADLAASFRGALEILPDRIAPELVPLTDTEAVRAVLVEAFEHALTDLADKIAKWGN